MIDVSIIIVSYNTQDFLKECLTAVFTRVSKELHYEVIVVDNNSKDDSIKMVRKSFPQVHTIVNNENLGFSKANNIGVAVAKGRYMLFLNSDAILRAKTLEEMIRFMDNHADAGAATCKVELPDGQIDDASHRGFPTPWNSFCHFSGISKVFPNSLFLNGYNLGWKDLGKIHEIDALAGAFMIVRWEAGEQIGWWDEDYFFYGEDLDFCYMLKKKGWKIYYVPTVSLLHYKGVSGGIKQVSKDVTSADKETKLRTTDARFDAMRIFYKKHYKNVYPGFVTSMVTNGINLLYILSRRKYQ
ncbi:MAG TPA: glycosyltransferase family 2 protein [Candidatus Saccharimonadales bacterium]|nr:glycosyltransferase family 2 protein [Candidatus Saccharimonadales bacterium]